MLSTFIPLGWKPSELSWFSRPPFLRELMRAFSVVSVGYISFVLFISAFFLLALSPFLKVPRDSALTHFLRLVSDADGTNSASAAWPNEWARLGCGVLPLVRHGVCSLVLTGLSLRLSCYGAVLSTLWSSVPAKT